MTDSPTAKPSGVGVVIVSVVPFSVGPVMKSKIEPVIVPDTTVVPVVLAAWPVMTLFVCRLLAPTLTVPPRTSSSVRVCVTVEALMSKVPPPLTITGSLTVAKLLKADVTRAVAALPKSPTIKVPSMALTAAVLARTIVPSSTTVGSV